jgi:hypothetical protein
MDTSFFTKIGKIGETMHLVRKKPEAIAPPRLTEPTRVPHGPFKFKTQLPKDVAYAVQASTDLKTWGGIGTGVATAEPVEFVDSEASKFNYRFFRLLAREVYSLNVVGYATLSLPPGFSMIADPFDRGNNSVAEVFHGWPDGTMLNKFDTRLFRLTENLLDHGRWTNPAENLRPGEGAILFNPASDYKTLTFAGEVRQGNLSLPIPAGFSVRSSMVPQPGNVQDLGFPIANGDVIHIFDRDRQKYVLHPFEGDKWTSGPPIVGIAESFWVAKTEPGNWVRNFTVQASA